MACLWAMDLVEVRPSDMMYSCRGFQERSEHVVTMEAGDRDGFMTMDLSED